MFKSDFTISQAQTNILIIISTSYAIYFALLTPPILTNSKFKAMFYDPFIGDIPTEVVDEHALCTYPWVLQYVNWPHTANNLLIVMSSATLYILLIVVLRTKQVPDSRSSWSIQGCPFKGAMPSEAGKTKMAVNGPVMCLREKITRNRNITMLNSTIFRFINKRNYRYSFKHRSSAYSMSRHLLSWTIFSIVISHFSLLQIYLHELLSHSTNSN